MSDFLDSNILDFVHEQDIDVIEAANIMEECHWGDHEENGNLWKGKFPTDALITQAEYTVHNGLRRILNDSIPVAVQSRISEVKNEILDTKNELQALEDDYDTRVDDLHDLSGDEYSAAVEDIRADYDFGVLEDELEELGDLLSNLEYSISLM